MANCEITRGLMIRPKFASGYTPDTIHWKLIKRDHAMSNRKIDHLLLWGGLLLNVYKQG
jgi:hypothetical protein